VHYVNRDAPRGFTAVPAKSFVGAQRVQRDLLHVDPRQLAAAPVLSRVTTPRPTPRSVEPPGPTQARPLVRASFEREVVARHAPPPSFAARAMAVRAGGSSPANAPAQPTRVRLLAGHGAPSPSPTAHSIEPVAEHGTPMPANRAGGFRAESDTPAARTAAETRPGELPSARFAHGQRGADAARNPTEPAAARGYQAPRIAPAERPGVSYISGSSRERPNGGEAPAAPAADRLPPVRHFERATPEQAAAAARTPAPERSEPREDGAPAQRFGQGNRMEHSMRAPDFNRPPPAEERPQRVDRPPPGYQPAQGYEPRRPMPQSYSPPERSAVRTAPAAAPARRAPAESGKVEHKAERRDDTQH
jgi:hypothetical protein